MTARSCDDCRYKGSPGWHWTEPENPAVQPERYPCPVRAAADQVQHAQELAKLAHENAWQAAQQIIRDAAETRPEFSANDLAEEFEQIPESLHGSAFTWAIKKGLIQPTGRSVMHRDPKTRHRISVWKSLVYRRSA